MTKLFISYAHLDSETVANVADKLRQAGYEVWMDISGIQGGDLWVEEITQAIVDCDVFVLMISANSVRSDHVRRELDIAFEDTKKVLPIRLEKIDIPTRWRYQLAGIQYIDYQMPHWQSRLLIALSDQADEKKEKKERSTGKLDNPYTVRPILEPIERRLILSNRGEELNRAVQYMEDHRLMVVTGMHGIGKSTFACALLDFRPPDAPDAFWYDFERQKSSGNTLGVLLDRISGYLDVTFNLNAREKVMAFRETNENASVNDVDALISFLNQEEPIWLVFDNLETVLSKDTQEFLDAGLSLLFDSLKNTKHRAKIIVTNPYVPVLKTSELLVEIGTKPFALQGIDTASSVALLRAYGLQDVSPEGQELLERIVNGHPFVLNQTAHYIQSMGGATDLDAILEKVTRRFAESLHERLSAEEFQALQIITVLNREMQMKGLCHVTQSKQSILLHLREKGLLETNSAGYYWLHSIVRGSITLDDPVLMRKAHVRAMEFYRKQPVPSFRQTIDAYAGVLEWHHHAVEAVDVVSSYLALFSTGLKEQLMEWNEYDLLLQLCEKTLACMYQVDADLSQVQANLSNMERIKIHHALGNIFFLLGDYPKSILNLDTATRLLPPHGDEELRFRLLIDLAESYNANQNSAATASLLGQLTRLFDDIKDDVLQAKFLHLQGIVHRDGKHFAEAVGSLEAAIRLYEKHNRAVSLGNARIDLGVARYYQNRYADALINYRLARISFEAQSDMRGMIISRYNIAEILLQQDQFQGALDEVRPAFEIAHKRKFTELELRTGLLLVEAQIDLSLLDEADRDLKRLSPLIAERASTCISGQELALQAYQQSKQNKPEQALKLFAQALRLLDTSDCQYEYARASLLLAGFLRERGEFERARDALSRAGTAFEKISSELGVQSVQRMFADLPK